MTFLPDAEYSHKNTENSIKSARSIFFLLQSGEFLGCLEIEESTGMIFVKNILFVNNAIKFIKNEWKLQKSRNNLMVNENF